MREEGVRRRSDEHAAESVAQVKRITHERRVSSVRRTILVLYSGKWAAVTFAALFAGIALVCSLTATRMYKASAHIEIVDNYDKHCRMLKSPSLAKTVAQELKWAGGPEEPKLTRDVILAMTKIERVGKPHLANITVQFKSPKTAARIANMLVEAYIEKNLNQKREAIRIAAFETQSALWRAGSRAKESEQEFARYRQETKVISARDTEDLAPQELSKLSVAWGAASVERFEKEAKYNYLKELSLDDLRHNQDVVNNKLIERLRIEELKAAQNLESLKNTYGDEDPKTVSAMLELTKVQEGIDGQTLKVVEEARGAYEQAFHTEKRLLEVIKAKTEGLLAFQHVLDRYKALETEAEINRKIYEEILRRSREEDIWKTTEEIAMGAEDMRTAKSDVRIVDRAEAPEKPFKPRIKHNILLAAVAGLIFGFAFCIFAVWMDDTVRNPDDIELSLKRRLLGEIPLSRAHDALRVVRSSICLCSQKILVNLNDSFKAILVTSVAPGEGKTTVAINLAVSAAQADRRVLLADCDLTRPVIHRRLNLSNDKSLTDYLTGQAGLDEIVQETHVGNLSAIAGSRCTNPFPLVSSDRMKEFLELVKNKFDLVFFDSPPSIPFAEVLVLAKLVDGVINVVERRKCKMFIIKRGIDSMERAGANLIGLVLNKAWSGKGSALHFLHYYRYYPYRRAQRPVKASPPREKHTDSC